MKQMDKDQKVSGETTSGPSYLSAVNWVKSYLSNRVQYTKINYVISDRDFVTSGVPQGSIFRPLLCMVYVNDQPESLDMRQCYLYADDTAIAVSDHHPQVIGNKLNQSLDTLTSSH